jgi:hypothetical protein
MPCFSGFDSAQGLVLVCAYTGKEVVGCKVQIVIVVALPDQVRWLRLRAVALRGFLRTLGRGKQDILSQTIREYGLIHTLSRSFNLGLPRTPDPPGATLPGTGKKRGATKSDHLSQTQTVHRAARRLKSLRAVLFFLAQ